MTSRRRHLKVFLCHASGDKPQVRALYDRLLTDGVEAWLDQEKLLPGQDWREEIPKAVREADVVVICLSNKSITKEGYIQKDIKFALNVAEEKPIGSIFLIPARLEECVVPEEFSRLQWVDLFSENGYEKLIMSLQARVKNLDETITLPRLRAVKGASKKRTTEMKSPEFDSQNRVLEAAIVKQVVVGTPTSLFVRIRRHTAKNIVSVITSMDKDVVIDEDNIENKELKIEFPVENGRVMPVGITLRLNAPGFTPSIQQKNIIVPPEGDSEVCPFLVTPNKAGNLILNLEVLRDQVSIASRTLHTISIESEKKESSHVILVSIPITVFVQASTSVAQAASAQVAQTPAQPAHPSKQSQRLGKDGWGCSPVVLIPLLVAIVAATATIVGAIINIYPTFSVVTTNTPIPPSPTPSCMSDVEPLVKFHILKNEQEIISINPKEVYHMQPDSTIDVRLEITAANDVILATPQCTWTNTETGTDGKFLQKAGCTVVYQSGYTRIEDAISLQVKQPSCPGLFSYAFFILPEQNLKEVP